MPIDGVGRVFDAAAVRTRNELCCKVNVIDKTFWPVSSKWRSWNGYGLSPFADPVTAIPPIVGEDDALALTLPVLLV
jgi:hypothetical protein